jgi:copper chaperone CopZ
MTDTKRYSLPGIHCAHCKDAVIREVEAVEGFSPSTSISRASWSR